MRTSLALQQNVARIGFHQAIVTLVSVAPSCNFHNKLTTQYKTQISPVGNVITHFSIAECGSIQKKIHNLLKIVEVRVQHTQQLVSTI